MATINFITTVSEDYFHHLPRLFFSLKTTFDDFRLIVFCVNVSEHNKNSLIFSKANVEARIHQVYFSKYEHQRGYCTNLRALALNEVSNSLADHDLLIYLDVNTLIHPPLKDFLDSFQSDVALSIDEDHPCYHEKRIINYFWPKGPLGTTKFGIATAGVQIYRISSDVKIFLENYYTTVRSKKLSWYADQEAIYLLYREFSNLNFFNIESILAIGRSPENLSIASYKKGGSDNSYYDNMSLENYFIIEGITENGEIIEDAEKKFTMPSTLTFLQRFCRKILIKMRPIK